MSARLKVADGHPEKWQAQPSNGAQYIPPNPVLAWWTAPNGDRFAWVADPADEDAPITYQLVSGTPGEDGLWAPTHEPDDEEPS